MIIDVKKEILLFCIKKTLNYLQDWRVKNGGAITQEEWASNNNTCLYLHQTIRKIDGKRNK